MLPEQKRNLEFFFFFSKVIAAFTAIKNNNIMKNRSNNGKKQLWQHAQNIDGHNYIHNIGNIPSNSRKLCRSINNRLAKTAKTRTGTDAPSSSTTTATVSVTAQHQQQQSDNINKRNNSNGNSNRQATSRRRCHQTMQVSFNLSHSTRSSCYGSIKTARVKRT